MTSDNPPILDAELPVARRELRVGPVLRGGEARKAIRSAFSTPVASTFVVILTVLWTIPTLGFLLNSLRTKEAVYSSGWWTWFAHPSFDLSNYHTVLFVNGGEVLPLVNSLAITIPATIIPIFIASMAAYALAWVRFRGSDFIFFGLFALQVIPLQMALVPLQRFYSGGAHLGSITIFPGLHLEGSLAEIWISHTMFSLPLAVFLLHNFIAQLPGSVIEAARVDGASYLRIYRSIVLPLAKPADRVLCDLPVPLGVERPARRHDLRWLGCLRPARDGPDREPGRQFCVPSGAAGARRFPRDYHPADRVPGLPALLHPRAASRQRQGLRESGLVRRLVILGSRRPWLTSAEYRAQFSSELSEGGLHGDSLRERLVHRARDRKAELVVVDERRLRPRGENRLLQHRKEREHRDHVRLVVQAGPHRRQRRVHEDVALARRTGEESDEGRAR